MKRHGFQSHFHSHEHRDGAEGERPSKSQLKREMTALQELGERLLALPPQKLRELPVPEKLFDAIELARRIKDREGLRRQRQYIGRLMRDIDPEPLRDALSQDGATHRAEVAAMHSAEQWRERLLREPREAEAFRRRYPGADAELDRLVVAARAEAGAARPGRRYRELFRLLRDTIAADAAEAASPSEQQPTSPSEPA